MTAVAVSLLRPLKRPRVRWLALLGILVLAAGTAAAYRFWFRDSGFVAVEAVRITGIDPRANDGNELAAALEAAAQEQTTLHVDSEALAEAAAAFPLVESVRAEPDFPHKLTVHVETSRPVARIGSGAEARAVDADGDVLPKFDIANFDLPRLPLDGVPSDLRVSGGVAEQVRVLAAAPGSLLAAADAVRSGDEGVSVIMPGGLELLFGPPGHARAKWLAAAAILSDPGLEEVGYVDLTSPARAAVGGSGVTLPPASSE